MPSLADLLHFTNGTVGLGSGIVKRDVRTPLTFDVAYPEDKRDFVQRAYYDAYTLAGAGFQAAEKQSLGPEYLRYFHEAEARYVVTTVACFKVAAEHPIAKQIPRVTIFYGDGDPACNTVGPSGDRTLMFIRGADQAEAGIWICPLVYFWPHLSDYSCDYARAKWPRTTSKMRTPGSTLLHEFLHYDSLAIAGNEIPIRDQKIQTPDPTISQRIAYGPFLSMKYKDQTVVHARDNDDNYIYMCIEAYWRQTCEGYDPQIPIDENPVQNPS